MGTPLRDPGDFFSVGGTLRREAPSYVQRPADQELLACLEAGEFCYILTSRQMGKSSLMVRTTQALQRQGYATVIIDLTSIGSSSIDEWYLGLLVTMTRQLDLTVDISLWWYEHRLLSVPQRFIRFLHNIVLHQITVPVVVCIDEIDSTLNLDFRDDFFAAIRAISNARSYTDLFKRLTFVLLGVATPTDLMRDRARTPFNIGRRIVLREFSYRDAGVLETGLELCHPGCGAQILKRIFYWTRGHPYLTQKLCLTAAHHLTEIWTDATVDALVGETFFSEERYKDSNLKFVDLSIRNSGPRQRRRMVELYRRVYQGQSVSDNHRSQTQLNLELYGLVTVVQGKLQVRNEIYRRVFNRRWIKENLPHRKQQIVVIAASLMLLTLALLTAFTQISKPIEYYEAQACTQLFNSTENKNERIRALACLFNLSADQYHEQAQALFFNLPEADQQGLFDVDNSASLGKQLVTTIEGIVRVLPDQSRFADTTHDYDQDMLKSMSRALSLIRQPNQPTPSELISLIDELRKGREHAAAGEYRTAVTVYKAIVEKHPNYFAVHYDLAVAYVELGDYQAARNQLATLYTYIDPHNTTAPSREIRLPEPQVNREALAFVGQSQREQTVCTLIKQVPELTGAPGTIVKSQAPLPSCERTVGSTSSVALSTDGIWMLLGDDHGTATLKQAVRRPNGTTSLSQIANMWTPHTTTISTVALSPDGQQVATGSKDGYIQIWDRQTHKLQRRWLAPRGSIACLAFIPASQDIVAVSTQEGTMQIWEGLKGKRTALIGTIQDSSVVACSTDGTVVAAASGNGSIQVWRISNTGQQLHKFTNNDRTIRQLLISPDKQRLVSVGSTGRVQLWDLKNMLGYQDPNSPLMERGAWYGTFSSDGQHLFIVDRAQQRRLLSVSPPSLPRTPTITPSIITAVPSLVVLPLSPLPTDGAILTASPTEVTMTATLTPTEQTPTLQTITPPEDTVTPPDEQSPESKDATKTPPSGHETASPVATTTTPTSITPSESVTATDTSVSETAGAPTHTPGPITSESPATVGPEITDRY